MPSREPDPLFKRSPLDERQHSQAPQADRATNASRSAGRGTPSVVATRVERGQEGGRDQPGCSCGPANGGGHCGPGCGEGHGCGCDDGGGHGCGCGEDCGCAKGRQGGKDAPSPEALTLQEVAQTLGLSARWVPVPGQDGASSLLLEQRTFSLANLFLASLFMVVFGGSLLLLRDLVMDVLSGRLGSLMTLVMVVPLVLCLGLGLYILLGLLVNRLQVWTSAHDRSVRWRLYPLRLSLAKEQEIRDVREIWREERLPRGPRSSPSVDLKVRGDSGEGLVGRFALGEKPLVELMLLLMRRELGL